MRGNTVLRPWAIDVPVALVFFNRPECFAKVFESVRRNAPSKLFLIQDGSRLNRPDDKEKIAQCREIASDIDWECQVHHIYSEVNLGCGRRIPSGISEAFQSVDRLIILEDDCVPSDSFYRFCQELLERYKDDLRVGSITGMNHLEKFDKIFPYDYLFSRAGSIAGWATWKRVWDSVDFELNFVDDSNAIRLLGNFFSFRRMPSLTERCRLTREKFLKGERLSAWSLQFGMASFLNSQFMISPRVNMMSNCGATNDSSNSIDEKMIPRGLRWLYHLPLYEFEFPLKHPPYLIEDFEYADLLMKRMRGKNFFFRKLRAIESVFLRLRYGDFSGLWKGLKRRMGIVK